MPKKIQKVKIFKKKKSIFRIYLLVSSSKHVNGALSQWSVWKYPPAWWVIKYYLITFFHSTHYTSGNLQLISETWNPHELTWVSPSTPHISAINRFPISSLHLTGSNVRSVVYGLQWRRINPLGQGGY